jgi:hypothetical protein
MSEEIKHDDAYHERFEKEYGVTCPDCRDKELRDEEVSDKIKTKNPNGKIQDILFLPNSNPELTEVAVYVEECSCTEGHPHFNLIYHDSDVEIQVTAWEKKESSEEAMKRLRAQVTEAPFIFDALLGM